jgi:hypothetical protein
VSAQITYFDNAQESLKQILKISSNIMGRQAKPLKLRDNIYYAQWLENRKHYRLSLGTNDQVEAMKRFHIVQNTKMSWEKYTKTTSDFKPSPVHEIKSLG